MRNSSFWCVVMALLTASTAQATTADVTLASLRLEHESFTSRLAEYGSGLITRAHTSIDSFVVARYRLPSYPEADSLFGLPRTTRAPFYQRAGRVTYMIVDDEQYRLHFWDLDGVFSLSSYSYGSWSDRMDPEVTEWLFNFIPQGHITWAMFHDDDPQWTSEMIVTTCEEIATRRSFKSFVVRDAPGLLAIEPVVVQAVEHSTFTPELRPRAEVAIRRFMDVVRDEQLKRRLEACLRHLICTP